MDEELTLQQIIDEETIHQLELLKSLPAGSEESKRAAENIKTLRTLSIDETKIDIESDERHQKVEALDKENELKQRELDIREKEIEEHAKEVDKNLEEAKKNRWVHVTLGALSIAVPAALYSSWQKKGFEFEKTGLITSNTFRGVINGASRWIGKMF